MNPVVLSVTCHTIAGSGSSQKPEAGDDSSSSTAPKGAIAFVGTTTSISGVLIKGRNSRGNMSFILFQRSV